MKKTKIQKREANLMLLVALIPFWIFAIYDSGQPFVFCFEQKKVLLKLIP